MTTPEELKHYYSIYFLEFDGSFKHFYNLGLDNKFFTKLEATNYITENPGKFYNLTLTILEIFEQ